jgi:hypothetical protein
MKKRNGDDPNPFNLRSKSMRGLDTESLIGWGWKQWSGYHEYLLILIKGLAASILVAWC